MSFLQLQHQDDEQLGRARVLIADRMAPAWPVAKARPALIADCVAPQRLGRKVREAELGLLGGRDGGKALLFKMAGCSWRLRGTISVWARAHSVLYFIYPAALSTFKRQYNILVVMNSYNYLDLFQFIIRVILN